LAYTFENHLHNFACWTAARAVQRNFTTTQNIVTVIEASDLIRVEEYQIQTAQEFDTFHRRCCKQLIESFKIILPELDVSYGRAAKIVAIYIKTSVIIKTLGEGNLAKVSHPPIDRILLANIHKDYKDLNVMNNPWTMLTETEYFELIAKLRTIRIEKFWELEVYWSVAQIHKK